MLSAFLWFLASIGFTFIVGAFANVTKHPLFTGLQFIGFLAWAGFGLLFLSRAASVVWAIMKTV